MVGYVPDRGRPTMTEDPFKPERENRTRDGLLAAAAVIGGTTLFGGGSTLLGAPTLAGVIGLLLVVAGFTAALLGVIELLAVVTGY